MRISVLMLFDEGGGVGVVTTLRIGVYMLASVSTEGFVLLSAVVST